ncbi:MAG: potassium-transporting ATPase subunit KdpC [Holosporales bacterium]|jgi:K+-transporting ATPase ATPase C chain
MIRPLFVVFIGLTLLCGVVYPGAVYGLLQVAAPSAANGSPLVIKEVPRGSLLLGQSFSDPKYFWGRISATGYDPTTSGSSHTPAVKQAAIIETRAGALYPEATARRPVPVDLVTESGSGLDPHISVNAARYQVKRVAKARGIPEQQLLSLIENTTEEPQFGFLGQARVNVLRLNLLLDAEQRL